MEERLKAFLEMENLTPARFADIMGIQRSGISHLLSGRNKPSFEFIEKMMNAFPSLSPEWLILGKGKPYKQDNPVSIPSNADSSTTPEPTQVPVKETVVEEIKVSEPSENRVFNESPQYLQEKSPSKIARITIFFSDGTYEDR